MTQDPDHQALLQQCSTHYRDLHAAMDLWLVQTMVLDHPGYNGGGEDEANYALAWFPHYLATGDERILAHFGTLRDALADWVDRVCVHGYEPEAESHHGTEPFLLFLPRYLGLRPDDASARTLLLDAAEHIGNWVAEVPPWYDEERGCFYGFYQGTRVVRRDAAQAYEVAEHFRFLHLALAAYRVGGGERYLDWALRYGRKRAQRLINAPTPLPLLWDLEGRGLDAAEIDRRGLHDLMASSHHVPHDPLAGVENLLASGAVQALGDLYRLSGDDLFRSAARRIVEPLLDSVLDPYADPGAAAILHYRLAFQDTGFDARLRDILAAAPAAAPAELALVMPERARRREPGVGRRFDMVYWGEWFDDGSVRPLREPCPAALTLAFHVTGNLDYARRALRGAAARLGIARRGLRSGREHADMGSAICAVAAGHGRNWGQGAVTGCYGPLLFDAREHLGALEAGIEVRRAQDRPGLPETLFPLVRPLPMGGGDVWFDNSGDTEVTCDWRQRGGDWCTISVAARDYRRFDLA
jgi:hypothetical protein